MVLKSSVCPDIDLKNIYTVEKVSSKLIFPHSLAISTDRLQKPILPACPLCFVQQQAVNELNAQC